MSSLWQKMMNLLFKPKHSTPLEKSPMLSSLSLLYKIMWGWRRTLLMLVSSFLLWAHKFFFWALTLLLFKCQSAITHMLANLAVLETITLLIVVSFIFVGAFTTIRQIIGYSRLIHFWIYMFFVGCSFFFAYFKTTQM